MHSYAIHAVPLIATLLNYCVTDVVVKAKHCATVFIIGIAYSVYNWYVVRKTGVPVYWFLDWKDHRTPLILMMLTLASTGFFYFLSFAT